MFDYILMSYNKRVADNRVSTATLIMDIEIIAPRKSADGIVFYVSADGSKTGISISGLERLIGMKPQSNLFQPTKYPLMAAMADGTRREIAPESLDAMWGNVFYPSVKGADNARIVSEDAAVAIIEFFAYDKKSDVAMQSFRKFARKGFGQWVKEVTHFATEPFGLNEQLLQAMQKMLDDKLDAVVGKASKWDILEGITAVVYPGMKALNECLSQEDRQKLLVSSDLYTVTQWLSLKNIVVDNGTRLAFSRQAADTYLTMTGQRPPDKYELKETTSGVRSVKVGKGYKMIDFQILETAWESYLQNQTELKNKPKAKRGRPKKIA